MRGSEAARGSAEVLGLVLLVPAALGLAVLVAHLGRQVDAQAQTRAAAGAGAHAGVLARSAAAAEERARRAVAAAMSESDSCATWEVAVDTDRFAPGGEVVVTVACTMQTDGLELLAVPATRFSATVSAAVDPYRALEEP